MAAEVRARVDVVRRIGRLRGLLARPLEGVLVEWLALQEGFRRGRAKRRRADAAHGDARLLHLVAIERYQRADRGQGEVPGPPAKLFEAPSGVRRKPGKRDLGHHLAVFYRALEIAHEEVLRLDRPPAARALRADACLEG